MYELGVSSTDGLRLFGVKFQSLSALLSCINYLTSLWPGYFIFVVEMLVPTFYSYDTDLRELIYRKLLALNKCSVNFRYCSFPTKYFTHEVPSVEHYLFLFCFFAWCTSTSLIVNLSATFGKCFPFPPSELMTPFVYVSIHSLIWLYLFCGFTISPTGFSTTSGKGADLTSDFMF